MTIHFPDSEETLDVVLDDSSYRYREIMGDDALTVKFSLAEHREIPVGSWTEHEGEEYTLARPEALTMQHSREFDYTVTFEGPQHKARQWIFRDPSDGRLRFSLTARPSEHLQMLIDNMNAREEGWEAGDCVESDEVCVTYDYAYCLDALAQMADAFGTEYEIDGRTVSLHKVEYNKNSPVALRYGQGQGLLGGVGRSNSSDVPPVEILYPQGGEDNIDAGKYPQEIHGDAGEYGGDGTGTEQNTHSSVLLLPPGREIGYDGERFSDEDGYDGEKGRRYAVDSQGYSVRRADRDPDTLAEDSLDCSEIYPKRVGTVAAVFEVENTGGDVPFYDFTDPDIGFDYNDYMIGEGPLTVIFQSGNLAGREFDVTYVHEAKDGKEARRFEVVQQEDDGAVMPDGGAFSIKPGDKYAVFGCSLPKKYICDDAAGAGAEWDMFRKCVRYMYGNEEENYTITAKMDGIWSRESWGTVGPKIRPGGYVYFTDERFQEEVLLIRITAVKDYINRPCSPELTLSNETQKTGLRITMRNSDNGSLSKFERFESRLKSVRGSVSSLEEESGELADRLAAAEGQVAEIGEEQDELSGKLSDFADSLTSVKDSVAELGSEQGRLADSLTSVESQVSDIGSEQSRLSDSLSSMEGQIGEIEEELGSLSGKLSDFAERLGSMEGQVGQLESGQDSLASSLNSLSGTVSDVDKSVSTMQSYVDDMYAELWGESGSGGLHSRVVSAEAYLGDVSATLKGTSATATAEATDGLISVVTQLQQAVFTLNNTMATLVTGFEPGGSTGGTISPLPDYNM